MQILRKDGKLTKQFKKLWVAALRSGKYQQITGQLRKENGFCCLGVACDVFNPSLWDQDYYSEWASAPFLPEHMNDTLSTLNDIDRRDFPAIANYIEKNY